jgi:hypothetical protein
VDTFIFYLALSICGYAYFLAVIAYAIKGFGAMWECFLFPIVDPFFWLYEERRLVFLASSTIGLPIGLFCLLVSIWDFTGVAT